MGRGELAILELGRHMDWIDIDEKIEVTYEVGSSEALHPDPTVVARMYEFALSDCRYGCKIYADPRSNVKVLAHNSNYGCPK
jgi:hypothetical protein